jgi:hypothetical protein
MCTRELPSAPAADNVYPSCKFGNYCRTAKLREQQHLFRSKCIESAKQGSESKKRSLGAPPEKILATPMIKRHEQFLYINRATSLHRDLYRHTHSLLISDTLQAKNFITR